MDDMTDSPLGERRHRRDWLNPLRLYDPRLSAEKLVFLWGLAIYPLVVMFVLLTVIIIFVETAFPNINPDYIGLIVWPFMLAWVAATVAITRRRLFRLGKSQRWVWVAIFPIVNLPLFLYLLLKSDPIASRWVE
jgi:hypothetical protein